MVSSFARTSPGKAFLARTVPAFDATSVGQLREDTSEVAEHRLRNGRLPLAGVEAIGPILDSLASSGGAAASSDFRPVLSVARAASGVRNALAKVRSPRLTARRGRLPVLDALLDSARRLFDADGSVRDSASPKLAATRERLRKQRGHVTRQLEKLLQRHREALGDSVVVLRNDRYCLPVTASARSRVAGIVHDRSGSGQTVFVEPLEVVESNNELALLVVEERHEVDRLVAQFGRKVLQERDNLERAVAELAELDAIEAKVEFGEISDGRLAEVSDDGGWTLRAARHPLLDPKLGPLRRKVLDETRPERPIVALDLELPRQKRLLVVSGPNAGGKTVVLKTAGLFSLMMQSGIPVPVAAGTRLPVFGSVRTEIGDAQAILSDRSTFSSSVDTLARILSEAGPETLALVDEIGGATDPEEGSALAMAWLEEYLSRGGRALVSTHLSAIKRFAGERPDAIGAAMEFDERTGRPNYRLHAGLSGLSRALSVARERLPETVVDRAEEILGDAWKRRQQQEVEAQNAIERLRGEQHDLEREREQTRQERERLSAERRDVADARAQLREKGLAQFDQARRELTRRVEQELAEIRKDSARRARDSASTLVNDAEESVLREEGLAADQQPAVSPAGPLAVGAAARLHGGKISGVIASLDGDAAWLEIAGKRMRVSARELEPAAPPSRGDSRRPEARRQARSHPPDAAVLTREVNVIGHRLDEAISEAEKSLDEALVAGAGRLRIIHGHGTGRLRDGLREHFRQYPRVASLRAGSASEGGNGATILELE